MITLCLETATARVGVALTRDGILVAETLLDAPGGLQNRLLLPTLNRLLADCGFSFSQIDLLACAAGPGSFTGIRTGIALIQGLSLALQKPCIGVSTLAMLAMNLPYATMPVCPMLDARKQEVYTACYQLTDLPTVLTPDQVIRPENLLNTINTPTIFLGDGALRYRSLLTDTLGNNAYFAPEITATIRPSAGCLLAEDSYASGHTALPELLLPTYLRLSEAEIAQQRKI